MSKITAKNIIVKGRVQGVFFRKKTQEAAMARQITGWVKNLADGSVQVLIQGEKSAVENMLNWCHKGPAISRVDKVESRDEKVDPKREGFDIRY